METIDGKEESNSKVLEEKIVDNVTAVQKTSEKPEDTKKDLADQPLTAEHSDASEQPADSVDQSKPEAETRP